MKEQLQKLALDWQQADWVVAVTVFTAYFAIDAMYVHYTLMVTAKKPLRAANISFVMHFLLAGGVLTYTHNPFYVLPLAMGSWAGTYWFTWRAKRMDNKRSADEPMLPGTRTRLLHLFYATNRCPDGDRLLRFVQSILNRHDLAPRDIERLSELDGRRLIQDFEHHFPDPDARIATSVVEDVSSRP